MVMDRGNKCCGYMDSELRISKPKPKPQVRNLRQTLFPTGEEEIVDIAYELGLGIASTLKPGDKDMCSCSCGFTM